jgi:Uma2 family endonuclease
MGTLAERQRPLRRVEYERLAEEGFFEDERIELINGVILEMSPQNVPHSNPIQLLTRLLVPPLVGRADVRVQLPFAADEFSMPEPDFAVVSTTLSQVEHPSEAFLVIEIANWSLQFDRGVKAQLYARVGVREYWVVNVVDQIVERYTDPTNGTYGHVESFRPGDAITLSAFPDVSVAVAAIFGG